MGYQTLIDNNLNRAFNLAKDLAKDVTLTKLSGVEFDFGASSSTAVASNDIQTKGIWVDSKKKSGKTDVAERQMMLKRKEIGDINSFDSIVEDIDVYRIGTVVKDDGYITIVTLFKES